MNPDEWLRYLIADDADQKAFLWSAYRKATPKQRRSVLLVEYRCKVRGCVLLTCWRSPMGRLVHLPGYKLSPERNAETVRYGQADRHWDESLVNLDALPVFADSGRYSSGLPLTCDHYSHSVRTVDLLDDAARAQPGNPTRAVKS